MSSQAPPRRQRAITVSAALLAAIALVGTALSPYLVVEHPLLLLGLNPDSRHVVLVANHVEPWQAVVVTSLRRGLNVVSIFAVASVHGRGMVGRLGSKRPWVTRLVGIVEAFYARIGIALVVLVPTYSVAALAGMARMPLRRFVLAIIPGQVAFTLAFLWFGAAIEDWTAPVLAFIASHLWETTLLAAAAIALQQAWSRRRKPQPNLREAPAA